MKKTIIFAALALISATGFCQTKKDHTKADLLKKDSTGLKISVAPASRQFIIVLREDELVGLYNFIQVADDYSPSGRQKYLQFLANHTMELPKVADSAAKKPDLKQ